MLLSYKAISSVVHPKRITLEEAQKCETEKGYWRNFSDYPITGYLVKMRDNYDINTFVIPSEQGLDAKDTQGRRKFVIITHGYTYNRLGSVKYVHIFRRLGYNCIIYDNRAHGTNGEAICTFGIEESKDLMELIEDTYRRYGEDIYLGLHGESMGAATTCMALGKKPNVAFAVVDCAYSSLIGLAKEKLWKVFHLPSFLIAPARIDGKWFYHFDLKDVEPAKALVDNEIPICFMHGEADVLIDCSHSKKLQAANKGYAELHLFPGADHAESLNSDEERYFEAVQNFLGKISD